MCQNEFEFRKIAIFDSGVYWMYLDKAPLSICWAVFKRNFLKFKAAISSHYKEVLPNLSVKWNLEGI